MKVVERKCQACKGDGIIVSGDQWAGRVENICQPCNGEGTYFEGVYGYQVYRLVPEKFYLLDAGGIIHFYIKRAEGYFYWANWLMASIGKVEEEYVQDFDNIDRLQEVEGDMLKFISFFFASDEPHMYWEGELYSELEEC